MPRSIASLSLSFGLVSIPVKVYAATESSAAIRFKLLARGGARVRRQYVADKGEALVEEEQDASAEAIPAGAPTASASRPREPQTEAPRPRDVATEALRRHEPATEAPQDQPEDEHEDEVAPSAAWAPVVQSGGLAPSQIVKGYEFEKGRFVTFTDAELKELAAASRPTIDIVEFIPAGAVDPVYYDRAYYLAPEQQGAKPYSLLRAAMHESGRTAIAKWAWRSKEYVVQIRPVGSGLVLQQLFYADEVRPIEALRIELADVGAAELALALRLIEQISDDAYHPERFVDEEKQRILAAVERKIAGRKVVAQPAERAPSAQVIDLVAALRASLEATAARPRAGSRQAVARPGVEARERKPARRAAKAAPPVSPTAKTRRQSSR